MNNNLSKAFDNLDQNIAKLKEQTRNDPEGRGIAAESPAADAIADLRHLIKSIHSTEMEQFGQRLVSKAVDWPADEQDKFIDAMEKAKALFYTNVHNCPNKELE